MEKSRAYEYARQCVNDTEGNVGIYIKKQCRKWLEIANNKSGRAYIDMDEYKRVCNILKIIVHPDLNVNMYEGLDDYAFLFVIAILCTFEKSRPDRRFYRTGLLEIARKNHKTFTAAVIFIILMLFEPRFSRLFSVAPDYKLSSELRLAVRKIIKVSPLLEKHFKITREMITCKLTDTEYTPLAYSNDRMDGKLATAFLADEVGTMDSYPVEAMRSSQIELKNPLGIIISTQYPKENSVFKDEIDAAKKVLDDVDGISDKLRVFALLYEPDEELISKWETDDRAIYQANPIAVVKPDVADEIRSKRAMAVLYDNKRAEFLCKHLNIRSKDLGVEGYIPLDIVQACRIECCDDFWRGRRVYLGIDLSLTEDNTSVAMVTYDAETETVYARVMGFIPAESVEKKTNKENFDYNRAIKTGCCIACGDRIIDYGAVENYTLTLSERLGVEVVSSGWDRANAVSSVQKVERSPNAFECVFVKQHSSVLHPATKKLKELILQGKFRYERNMLLENNFENSRCTEDTNLNKYVNKKKSSGKVDMVVALINAMYILMEYELAEEDFICQSF